MPPGAQPVATDLGHVFDGSVVFNDVLADGGLNWYRFTIEDVSAVNGVFLTIDTRDSTLAGGSYLGGNDSEIALFDADGLRLAHNDDIDQLGDELLSEMSFGADQTEPIVEQFNLAAGEYFVAVAGFGVELGASEFETATSNGVSGGLTLTLTTNAPEADCNANGLDDVAEALADPNSDCDGNSQPDECQIQLRRLERLLGPPLATTASTSIGVPGAGALVPVQGGGLVIFRPCIPTNDDSNGNCELDVCED